MISNERNKKERAFKKSALAEKGCCCSFLIRFVAGHCSISMKNKLPSDMLIAKKKNDENNLLDMTNVVYFD